MNKRIILAGLVLATTTPALAGSISGAVREGAKPVVNERVMVTCGAERVEGVTDERGRYRVHLRSTGRCRFELPGRGVSDWVESTDMPERQDFSLSGRSLMAR